jgi:hypothetical protein
MRHFRANRYEPVKSHQEENAYTEDFIPDNKNIKLEHPGFLASILCTGATKAIENGNLRPYQISMLYKVESIKWR